MARHDEDAPFERATPGVDEFLRALSAGLGQGALKEVDVYCTHRIGRVVELRRIAVRGPVGTGRGSEAMEALLDLADEADVDLHVQPFGERGITTERLDGWYRRLGCEPDPDEPGRLAYRAGSRRAPAP